MFKRDLSFRTPLMNAAGTLGFAPDIRAAVDWDRFGAFVTNPISLRPRMPTANPGIVPYAGGFLLHTGLPNPGFFATVKKYAPRWADSKLPIIVNLMADRPEETAQMVKKLENVENIAAVELGFAPLLSDDIIMMALEMSLGELPILVSLPWEQLLNLGPRLAQAGAIAISIAPPRGALPADRSSLATDNWSLVTGRLYGPSLFPQSLSLVRDAVRSNIPIIGGCGVYSQDNIDAMLAAGAQAVQIDSVLWRGWK